MVLTYLLTFPVRLVRWSLMLGAGYDRVKLMESIVLGFSFNNLLPARAGELVRMEHFSRWSGKSRITALTSVLSEKVLDCVVLLLLLATCGLFYALQFGINEKIYNFSILFGVAIFLIVGGVALVYRKRIQLVALLRKWNASPTILNLFVKVCDALEFLSNSRSTFMILVASAVIWILEGLVFVIGVHAFNIPQSLLIGFTTLCFVNFAILIPSSPGYVGVFQLGFIFAFSIFHLSSSEAMSASVLVHSCQYFPVTLMGVLLLLKNSLKKVS
jgi:uncharacterized protein (TIRG00374 family)